MNLCWASGRQLKEKLAHEGFCLRPLPQGIAEEEGGRPLLLISRHIRARTQQTGRDLANEPLSHNGRHFPHARRPHQRLPRGRQSSLLVQLLQITQRYHQRRESPPRFRVVSSPWWHHVPELRPADAPQEYLPVGAQHDLAVRPSFLSPVKRNYVWTTHPQRQAYSLKKQTRSLAANK